MDRSGKTPYQFLCSNMQQGIKTGAKFFDLNNLKSSPQLLHDISNRVKKLKNSNIDINLYRIILHQKGKMV